LAKPTTVSWWVNEGATDPLEKYSLLVDTVNSAPLSRDLTYVFRDVGKYTDDMTQLQRQQITGDFQYPRNIAQTPGKFKPN